MSGDVDPLVQALQRKLNNAVERIEELENRVAELEQTVDPDPADVSYEQLTKDQKVFRIRKALGEEANRSNTHVAQMKYKAIMALFNNKPSPGHAYDLMERAAHADGYEYDTAGQGKGEKRIRVKWDDVNDERLIHAVNNGQQAAAV